MSCSRMTSDSRRKSSGLFPSTLGHCAIRPAWGREDGRQLLVLRGPAHRFLRQPKREESVRRRIDGRPVRESLAIRARVGRQVQRDRPVPAEMGQRASGLRRLKTLEQVGASEPFFGSRGHQGQFSGSDLECSDVRKDRLQCRQDALERPRAKVDLLEVAGRRCRLWRAAGRRRCRTRACSATFPVRRQIAPSRHRQRRTTRLWTAQRDLVRRTGARRGCRGAGWALRPTRPCFRERRSARGQLRRR